MFTGRLRACLEHGQVGGTTAEIELGEGSDARVFQVRTVRLADPDGESLGQVVVLRDITAYQHAQTLLHASFLAEASAALASSLDYEATLQQVASLAIPALGDWCTVYMLAEDQEVRRVAVAYTDGEKAELAQALRRYPPSPVSDRSSVAQAMRTGRSILTPVIPEAYVGTIAQDAEHLEIMRRLGVPVLDDRAAPGQGRRSGGARLLLERSGAPLRHGRSRAGRRPGPPGRSGPRQRAPLP